MRRAPSPVVDLSLAAIRRLFRGAFDEFRTDEARNIANGVSERNLCQRLAFPLERWAHAAGLEDYRADVEYNRANDGRLKTIVGENMETVTITCDLILHSRGLDPEKDNLIAIEMKRSTHPEREKHKDRVRLIALTRAPWEGVWSADGRAKPEHVCDYVVGYFVELDSRAGTFRIEEYARGELVNQFEQAF